MIIRLQQVKFCSFLQAAIKTNSNNLIGCYVMYTSNAIGLSLSHFHSKISTQNTPHSQEEEKLSIDFNKVLDRQKMFQDQTEEQGQQYLKTQCDNEYGQDQVENSGQKNHSTNNQTCNLTLKESDIQPNQIQFQCDQMLSITEEANIEATQQNLLQSDELNTIVKRKSIRIYNGKKSKKNRKIRTTITKEKLVQMNKIFAEYTSQKEQGKNPLFNLKQIGQQLQLGYSTILHKFREFRATKKVKGGALIASLQKKRKYKKSLQIQQIIERALTQRPFYTAVELSKYILCKFQRNFSRSIISRHLGEMGYSYKNLKSTPIQKNKSKYKQIRRMYAQIIAPMLHDDKLSRNMIYIDQMACSLSNFIKRKNNNEIKKIEAVKDNQEYVSVLIAARCEEIIYYQINQGFITRNNFCNALINIRRKMNQLNKYDSLSDQTPLVVINDLNKIHRDSLQGDHQIIKQTLIRLNMRQYFLPPFSFQLNPLQTIFLNIKNRINKRQIKSVTDLHMELIDYMQDLQKENIEVHFKEIPDWLQKSLRQQNF